LCIKKRTLTSFDRLRDAVRRNRSEIWGTNCWFLLHGHAPAHRSVFVKDFLSTNNVSIVEHPPFSPNMASADFYPFPRLNSAWKGRRFFDVTDITENASEELKRLSHKASRNVSHTFTVPGRIV
jgi:hypothetical protein